MRLDPRRTALLLADFYAEQMEKLPHAASRHCVANARMLLEAARRAGVIVCYCVTAFRSGYVDASERNRIASAHKRSGRPVPEDPAALIHPLVKSLAGETVITKHRASAFHGTDLALILQARDIDTLLLLGHATGGVILATTRYAADADYRLFIVEDCCADPDPAVHDFLCRKIFPRQAEVVQSADVIPAIMSAYPDNPGT